MPTIIYSTSSPLKKSITIANNYNNWKGKEKKTNNYNNWKGKEKKIIKSNKHPNQQLKSKDKYNAKRCNACKKKVKSFLLLTSQVDDGF